MSISEDKPDLFHAILAMDAYNREDDAGMKGITQEGIGLASLGTFSGVSSSSFFAQAYTLNGKTIISYRGTDSKLLDAATGYGVGAGVGVLDGNLTTLQGSQAISFYQSILEQNGNNVVLTGHSLGGGLAGLVAGLYGEEARIFDHMPFQESVETTYNYAKWVLDETVRDFIYGGQEPWLPDFSKITSSYIPKGSAWNDWNLLAWLRPNSIIKEIPYVLPEGVDLERTDNNFFGQRHDPALNVIRMYLDGEEITGDWQYSAKYFMPTLFDDALALKAGAKPTGIEGSWNPAGKMMGAIAYSAIDEGERPFGDTGIRALADDANDLGNALKNPNVSKAIQSTAKGISQAFVQYAGQISLGKVLEANSPFAVDGVLSLSADKKVLAVDFSDELWKVGGTAPPEILGRKEIVDAVILDAIGIEIIESITPLPGTDHIHSGMEWLWGSDSSDIIDRVELATTNGELTTTLQNRTTTSDKVSLFVAGGSSDDITGSRDDNMIFGGEGNDTLRGGAGDDLLAGGIGDDRLSGGEGRNFLDGGRGKDTTFYEHDQGVRMTMTKVEDSTVGQPIFELDLGHGTVDRITGIEKIELTDRPDYLRVDQSALGADITIDMGKSDWDQDFIKNRDTVDYSDFDTGLTYWNGSVGTGFKSHFQMSDDLVIKGAEKVILTNHNDWVVSADPGMIIETGDGNDVIWAMGNNVAISDLSYTDRIALGGVLPLLGGVRNIHSNSIYAAAWGGLFQYAVNHLGELKISSPIFGDMWVLNYGDSAPYGEKAGHIYLYQFEMEVLRLVDMKPSHMTVMGTWDLVGILLKTHFGMDWGGLDPLVLDLDGDGIELSALSSISPRFDIDGDLYAERTGWVKSDDGFLVRDLNGNGVIDDLTEMFGNSTTGGFAALAQLDRNGDGQVDAADDAESFGAITAGDHFSDLRVWRDLNQDGQTDAGELFTLADLGIQSISVGSKASHTKANGNDIVNVGTFTRTDGSTGTAGEVIFAVDNINTDYVGPRIDITEEALALPDLMGQGTLVSLRQAASLSQSARDTIAATLPKLTSHNLADLRVAATPILQAWVEASPLGDDDRDPETTPATLKPHGDLHILVETDATGRQTVRDVAFQTSSLVRNETGQTVTVSHWALASGARAYDEDGQEIQYPTLEQLFAADFGPDKEWNKISGTLIGVVERMIGEALPLELVQPTGKKSIPGLADLANTILSTLDLVVVRIAVQDGPLSQIFKSIAYDAATNQFTGLTDSELAPVYTAILAEAGAGGHGVDWLQGWRPILDIVIGDFARHGSDGRLLNTYGFIAHNVVHAFETVMPGLAFADVAAAFGIPADILVTGTGTGLVSGSSQADILYGQGENFTLQGGHGADEYIIGHAIGHSVVDDYEEQLHISYDILRFVFLNPDDVYATRSGTDLLITVKATGETVLVPRQFGGEWYGPFGGDLSEDTGINEIVFADGTVWQKIDIAMAVSHPDPGSTVVEGTSDIDYLDGGAGDDILRGAGDGDVYIYARGYGNDRIEDFEDCIFRPRIDVLILKGLTPGDVEFLRNGAAEDLIIKIRDTGETLTIKDQFAATYTGVFGTAWMSQIEAIFFADGSSMTAGDIMARMMEIAGTDGDDIIYGFSREDRLDGGAGNDFLAGGNESDTYVYGIGYGHDTISDCYANILSGNDDRVVFRPGISAGNVTMERYGYGLNDLRFTINSTGETLSIEGQFGYSSINYRPYEIEFFEFSDGTVWTAADLRAEYLTREATEGNDVIEGFWSHDIMTGGAGNDILRGNDGSDTYIFDLGFGDDVIEETVFNVMHADFDTVVFGAGLNAADAILTQSGNDLIITFANNSSDRLTIRGQFNYAAASFTWNDIEEFRFADGTVWTDTDIRLHFIDEASTDGNDIINGYHTADVIDAGAGDDIVNAGGGNDIIVGGTGNDILRGQDGSDTYMFELGFGDDVIEETVDNVMHADFDTVVFGAGLNAADAILTRSGEDLIITFAGNPTDRLTIRGQFHQFSNTAFTWADIEEFRFADGTVWTEADVRLRLLEQASTDGNDTIVGYLQDDVITGGKGDDILKGAAGNDTYIYSRGDGHDTIIENYDGGSADRLVLTNIDPKDVTLQRNGNDVLLVIAESAPGAGNGGSVLLKDSIDEFYGQGVESVVFADGTEWTRATIRNMLVSIAGTPGNDTITGTNAADVIDAGAGDDIVNAGSGNDQIIGGAGNDILRGQDGSDTYVFEHGSGDDVIEETVNNVMHGDFDTVVFGAGLNAADAILTRRGNDLIVTFAGNATDRLTIRGQFNVAGLSYTWNDIEEFRFADGAVWTDADIRRFLLEQASTDGDDVIEGFALADVIDGGTGNDILRGFGGGDTYLFGVGSGRDTIEESVGSLWEDHPDTVKFQGALGIQDVEFARSGNDLVITIKTTGDRLTIKNQYGSSYNQVELFEFSDGTKLTASDIAVGILIASGTSGDDMILGTANNDTITGGRGNDILRGGEGNDTYVYSRGDGDDTITENTWSGNSDRLVFANINPGDVTLVRNGNDVTLVIAESYPGAGDGGSILLKDSLDEYFNQGVEQIVFADGTVWTRAILRNKLVSVMGTSGDDTLAGTNAADVIDAGDGNDIVNAGGGDDIVTGGKGADQLNGSAGNDAYIYSRGDGHDTITENTWSGNSDRLVFADINPGDVALVRNGNNVTLVIAESSPGAGDAGSILLKANLDDYYDQGVDQIVFADGTVWTRETLRLALLAMAMTDGNDVITGTNVADVISAGTGNDTVNAGDGDDTITGGRGDDTLNGGSGNDTYYYARGDGHDTITENTWSGNSDRLVLANINPGDVTLVRNGNDVTLIIAESTSGAGNGGSILLKANLDDYYDQGLDQIVFADGTVWTRATLRELVAGLRVTHMGTDGDDTLTGTSGNDVLDGGSGNDGLKGGSGSDTYIFGRGYGNDIIVETTGTGDTDRVELIGLNSSDVMMSRNVNDLLIKVVATGEVLTVQNHFYATANGVEQVVFADGTTWDQNMIKIAAWHRGGEGNETLTGSASNDTLDGGAGNDTLKGGNGSDIYRYGVGYGNDTVNETSETAGDTDRIELIGLTPGDVMMSRTGNNLLITVIATGEVLTVQNHFYATANGVEQVVFADGMIWDRLTIQKEAWHRGTDGNDTLTGSALPDSFAGGKGNDTLQGGDGDDTYIYAKGDGNDTIKDNSGSSVNDTLRLTDLNVEDVVFSPSGINLSITVRETGEVITVLDQFWNSGGAYHYSIENIVFADGTTWNWNDIQQAADTIPVVKNMACFTALAQNDSDTFVFPSLLADAKAETDGIAQCALIDSHEDALTGQDHFVFKAGLGTTVALGLEDDAGFDDPIVTHDNAFADYGAALAQMIEAGNDGDIGLEDHTSIVVPHGVQLHHDDFRFVA